MKIGVLGTGMVGTTIGSKLIQLGHEVKMGSRTATNEKAKAWAEANAPNASHGAFRDSAAFGEILFNCTLGVASVEALGLVDRENLKGKVLIDIANPLDFSRGMPPTLTVCNDDSLGEQIQRNFPEIKVVKTLNTVNCNIMVDPSTLPEDHDIFMSGNDPEAKAQVTEILRNWFGWKSVTDLGDISTARGTEMYLSLWIRLAGVLNTGQFNFKIVR